MSKGKSSDNKEKKNESFFEKMKSDKKYNAKVQLLGYGVFVVILVLYLNLSSLGNGNSNMNSVIDNLNNNGLVENTDKDDTGLLKSLSDNYSYDIVLAVNKKSMNVETNEEVLVNSNIQYKGKSYNNKLEINKVVADVNDVYYKVDNIYYNRVDNMTSVVKEEIVYDVVDSEYIELSDILKLMDKASLDHVTNYSSGKKESVYHLKVKDVVVSHQGSEVVEINVLEENGVLKINIDYSNLFKVIDENVEQCKLEASISNIGKVEDFDVVVSEDKNTSEE